MVTVVSSSNLPPRTHKAGWRLSHVIKCVVLGGNRGHGFLGKVHNRWALISRLNFSVPGTKIEAGRTSFFAGCTVQAV